MSNREKARKLREEVHSSCNCMHKGNEQIKQLEEQVNQLQEKVAELQGVSESLIENVASLEEENLELKRAMEAQSTSFSS